MTDYSTMPQSASTSAVAVPVANVAAAQVASSIQVLSEAETEAEAKKLCEDHLHNIDKVKAIRFRLPDTTKCYRMSSPLAKLNYQGISDIAAHGTTLAIGSIDGTIVLCDTTAWHKTPTVLARNEGLHSVKTPGIKRLTFTQNGLLVSATDKEVKLWDVENTSCLASQRSDATIASIVPLPDNQTVACGYYNVAEVKFWDTKKDQSRTLSLSCSSGSYNGTVSLAVLPNNQLAYLPLNAQAIGIIDCTEMKEGAPISIPDCKEANFHSLCILNNGHIAIGSGDFFGQTESTSFPLRVINTTEVSCELLGDTEDQHANPTEFLVQLPNRLLVSGASDLKLWDPTTRKCVLTLPESCVCCATTTDDTIAIASPTGIKLLQPQLTNVAQLSKAHQTLILQILHALKRNESAELLDLSGQPLIDDSFMPLIIKIFDPAFWSRRKPNTTLKFIDLRNTNVSEAAIKKLQTIISKRKLAVKIISNWSSLDEILAFDAKQASAVQANTNTRTSSGSGSTAIVMADLHTTAIATETPIPIDTKAQIHHIIYIIYTYLLRKNFAILKKIKNRGLN